jgi:hypothetical protein
VLRSAADGTQTERILFRQRIKEDGNDLLQLFCQSKWYTTCFNFICYCLSNYFVYTDLQKWIGFADVKSTPLHFFVQRNSDFNTKWDPIPFDLARVNEGNAMNLTSGKFTAPRPGIYFFSFTGRARLLDSSSHDCWFFSHLFLNGNRVIGSSDVREPYGPVDQFSPPLTLQSTLNLKKGDQLWVIIDYSGSSSYLRDYIDYHFTHFTGFMLEEEIGASL